MLTFFDVVAASERLWPQATAMSWDHVGVVLGHPTREVSRIVLMVDVTEETVADAIAAGAQAVIAHHPLLFRPVDSLSVATSRGRIVHRLIEAGCGLLCAHTNADQAATGTSAVLGARLGLVGGRPILAGDAGGIGVIGTVPEPVTLMDLARTLAGVLPATARGVAVSGPPEARVNRIAVCAGAGDSLLDAVAADAADAYVTSDLRHHPAIDFRAEPRPDGAPYLLDVSHWAAEQLWLDQAAAELAAALPGAELVVSRRSTDVWDFVVTQ